MQKITIKQGDTFSYNISLRDENDAPLIIPIEDLQSQIRKKNGALVDSMVITAGIAEGEYVVTSPSTSNYPTAEKIFTDVKYTTDNGLTVSSTDTIEIVVLQGVTKWQVP